MTQLITTWTPLPCKARWNHPLIGIYTTEKINKKVVVLTDLNNQQTEAPLFYVSPLYNITWDHLSPYDAACTNTRIGLINKSEDNNNWYTNIHTQLFTQKL